MSNTVKDRPSTSATDQTTTTVNRTSRISKDQNRSEHSGGEEDEKDHNFQRQVEIDGWEVRTVKRPILNSKEIKTFSERLKIPLPEICFGNNRLTISHRSSGFSYDWNTLDALLSVSHPNQDREGGEDEDEDEEDEMIKVSYADNWSKARKPNESIAKVVNPYDWTYTTTYCGTTSPDSTKFSTPETVSKHPGIPLDELRRPDPILFFDEVNLFEDELHDNGMASLQVKVRVMPSCIFALSRFFLRVDGVIFRLMDVRFYVDVKKNLVIREIKAKEMSYEEVKKKLPIEKSNDLTPLTDPNWVSQIFGMLNDDRSEDETMRSSRSIESFKKKFDDYNNNSSNGSSSSNGSNEEVNQNKNKKKKKFIGWKKVLGTYLDLIQL